MVVKMLAGESSFCFCVVLLLFIVILSRRDCLAKTFEVIRGTPSSQPIAADSYDIGTYIYQGRIIEIRCLNVHNGKCSCNWGGTFVFTKSIKALTPKCFAAYNDLFGCQFRWKAASNYVKAIERPQSKGDKTIDDVQLNYNSIKSILSLANVSYWNMTWVEIPNPPFAKSSDKIEWTAFGASLHDFVGRLLKFEIVASLSRSQTSYGCILLKVAGTNSYPLSTYNAAVSPRKSKISTPYVSNAAVVSPSFSKQIASSSAYLAQPTSSAKYLVPVSASVLFSSYAKINALSPSATAGLSSSIHWSRMQSRGGILKTTTQLLKTAHAQTATIERFSSSYFLSKHSNTDPSSTGIHPAKSSFFKLSSSVPNGSATNAMKETADRTPLIVGASIGSIFGITATILGLLLYRRKLSGDARRRKTESIKQKLTSINALKTSGYEDDQKQRQLGNPTYDEEINLRQISKRKEESSDLYELAYNQGEPKNQQQSQVRGEVDQQEDGPVYKELMEDGPVYKELMEDGPVYKEIESAYQPIDESVIENPNVYQPLNICKAENWKPKSSYTQEESIARDDRAQSPVYQTLEPEKEQGVVGDSNHVHSSEPIYNELEA